MKEKIAAPMAKSSNGPPRGRAVTCRYGRRSNDASTQWSEHGNDSTHCPLST